MEKDSVIKTLGYVGTTLAILMFVSLIEIAKNNLYNHTHIFIQPFVTVLNCTIWSFYAYLSKEKFVLWANLPGIVLGIVTFITAFV